MMIYVREAARSLYSNKQRTVLALIGIVIGIASVIALISIGKIVRNEATKQFLALGTDLVAVRLSVSDPQSDLLRDSSLYEQMPARVRCLTEVSPFTKRSTEVRDGQISRQVDFMGVDGSFAQAARLRMASGRFISSLDGSRYYAVLGASMPEVLQLHGSAEDLVGQQISLRERSFTIVGVLQPKPRIELIHSDMNQAIFIPYATAVQRDANSRLDQLLARRHPDADSGACSLDISQYFQRRAPGLHSDVTTAEQLIAQMRKQSDMLAAMLAAIGSISLVVGGVGIMNILLVSVSERRREIGIRRALGAHQSDIRYQFLIEAVLLATLGGVLGVILGVGASVLVAQFQDWEFFFSPGTVVLGVGVSVIIGVFFGFFPAHQAAQQDPIAALHDE